MGHNEVTGEEAVTNGPVSLEMGLFDCCRCRLPLVVQSLRSIKILLFWFVVAVNTHFAYFSLYIPWSTIPVEGNSDSPLRKRFSAPNCIEKLVEPRILAVRNDVRGRLLPRGTCLIRVRANHPNQPSFHSSSPLLPLHPKPYRACQTEECI